MDKHTILRGFGFITPAPTPQEREAAMAAHPAGKGRVPAEAPSRARHRAEPDWAVVTPINTGSTRHLDRVGSDWNK